MQRVDLYGMILTCSRSSPHTFICIHCIIAYQLTKNPESIVLRIFVKHFKNSSSQNRYTVF